MTKYQKILLTYKIYYIIYLLVAFNAFLNERSWFPYLTYVTAGAGALMILISLPKLKSFFKDKIFICLVLFIISWGITSILHRQYGIMENAQGIIWLTIQAVVLYAAGREFTTTNIKREFRIIAVVYIAICSIFNIISLSMLKWGYMYDLVGESTKEVRGIGFRMARLWGVYDDPNHGAIITLMAFFFALYLISYFKELWKKIVFIIALLIQALYIVFSDSRTAFIGLIAGVAVYSFGYSANHFAKEKKEKRTVLAGLATILCVVVVAGISVSGWHIEEKVFLAQQKAHSTNTDQKKEKPKESQRKKEVESDITSGRLDIWQDGLTIFKENPVLGIGQRNMQEYALEKMPKAHIVVNDTGVRYDSLHDMPLDVLLSQGAVGGLLLLAMMVLTLQKVIKQAGKLYNTDKRFYYTLFAVLISALACSMFISMIFYVHTPATYVFWLCLGYFINLLNRAGNTK